ncbi:heme-binding protein [Halapricum hydrolyticum]|uniref:Heme-binding protein n=1 Tax=Halapricum hydrolyticum TaxID=2979991 RepID=A0AAE3IA39_9EURY|nr:heme-binding protein [Halapricum hydrolyticum]MCU4717472.1 heme-binding protein [Halapricum hydrolyticum]MCU4726636.1 heme-binding protein [Halapricum hydrolyticum]
MTTERRDAPPTAEGWYVLHDVRTIDWAAWDEASQRTRDRAIEEGIEFLQSVTAVEDADGGGSMVVSMLGHKGDLMIVHMRPTLAGLDELERRFERTALATFTDQIRSFVSVTEASGYSERGREFIEGDLDDDSGLARYMRSRLYPEIPEKEHVCFYPMDKRRDLEYNWYDLPFEERAEHMDAHGDIGREYAGRVTQMITGAIGMDDWEWGVTLYADDMVDVKDLLYEMRFDPSSSKFAEFGPFWIGRRFDPADLDALLAGEPLSTPWEGVSEHAEHDHPPATPEDAAEGHGHDESGHPEGSGDGDHPHGDTDEGDNERDDHPSASSGRPPTTDSWSEAIADIDEMDARLGKAGLYEGEDYTGRTYALVFETDRDAAELAGEVEGLASNFDHYDTHVTTAVRASGGHTYLASLWTTEDAAQTASGFLTDLDGIDTGARGWAGSGGADDASTSAPTGTDEDDDIRSQLAEQNIYAGQPHGEDVYALVVYSEADLDRLRPVVEDLRASFAGDDHVKTAVYDDPDGEIAAVVSLWEDRAAAQRASDDLESVPGVVRKAGEGDGFGTMGMFYTVKPAYREEFVETFGTVGEKLEAMEGHRETALLVNDDDANDMFIASQWDSRDDAMAFFRSEDFRETVQWGREILDDTPRHVFLA